VSDTTAPPLDRHPVLAPWVQGTLLFALAFVLRAATALAGFPSGSEQLWLGRSQHYVRHLLLFDLPTITSTEHGRATMPGITTSIVGGLARLGWGGARDLGVVSFPGELFSQSRSGLIASQLLVSAAIAGLVVLLWWVLRRWSTPVVAVTAAVLVATEPALVFDGTKLTTDPFVTLFGVIGAFALAAALDVPAGRGLDGRARRVLAIVAGIGIGGALLSKVFALAFGPFFAGLVVYAVVREWPRRERVREALLLTALAVVVALVLIAILWPALWADPHGQLKVVERSARMGSDKHQIFFLGEVSTNPSPFFYALTVPLRMTPWLFVLSVAGVVAGLRTRALRGFAVVTFAYVAVPIVAILVAQAKFVRYSYPLWPSFAVLAGLAVQWLATWSRARGAREGRAAELVAVGAIAGIVTYALLVVPYGGAYANPLLGGGPVAQEVMAMSNELQAEAGYYIRDREGDRCGERRILTNSFRKWFPCGEVVTSPSKLRPGDYVVLTGTSTRLGAEAHAVPGKKVRHVATIEVRGVDIADVSQVT
jgi:4-amino-4-deoxy-L-arabinose transferase-like glycosyltransferase